VLSFDVIVAGLAVGSMYGLLALGYHVTYAVSNTVNFSQGASLMLGAVLLYTFQVRYGWGTAPAILVSLGLCALFGLLVERFAVRPFARDGSISWLLTTIAVGIVLENLAMLTFGKESRGLPSPLAEKPLTLFGAGIYPLELVIPAVGLALAGLLHALLRGTRHGKALLAVAQNRDAAALMGIPVERVIAAAFALSTVLAGIAGMLIAPKFNVSAQMGTLFGLKAFAVAIIGGITSSWGVMIAGLGYGLLEAIIAAKLPSAMKEILGFAIVVAALALKPQGLFGRVTVTKV
jgi:branched-chain amino acid transport system permease protein